MIALWFLACGEAEPVEVDNRRHAVDFAGPAGMHLEYVLQAEPEGTPLMLRIAETLDGWETREGQRWADGTDSQTFVVSLEDGLRVDDTLLLPALLQAGTTAEGVSVVSLGELEVWYGLFSEVASVEVAEGPWAGPQAFARDIGPILLTYSGETWELAGYEPL